MAPPRGRLTSDSRFSYSGSMPTVQGNVQSVQAQGQEPGFSSVDRIIAWLERDREVFESLDKYQTTLSAAGRSVKFQTTQYGE